MDVICTCPITWATDRVGFAVDGTLRVAVAVLPGPADMDPVAVNFGGAPSLGADVIRVKK